MENNGIEIPQGFHAESTSESTQKMYEPLNMRFFKQKNNNNGGLWGKNATNCLKNTIYSMLRLEKTGTDPKKRSQSEEKHHKIKSNVCSAFYISLLTSI